MTNIAYLKDIIFHNKIYEEIVLDEAANKNVRKIGSIKVARIRIRNGKVLRNKKFSAVKGVELVRGKLKRLNSTEKRRRKIATNAARYKIRAKLPQILRKRAAALKKRKALGG